VIFWLAGEFDAAEPPIQRALAAAALAHDDRLRARIAASWANLVLATEDRVEEAMALADVAETWATDPAALVGWRTARARALVRLGDAETADRLGRQAVSLAEQTDSTDLRANALLHLAEVLQRAGRPAEAGPFQRRALRVLDRKGSTAQAAAIFRQIAPTGSDRVDDADQIGPEELAADGDLELEPPQQLEPLAEQAGEPTPLADASGSATETEAGGDATSPVDDLPLDQPAEAAPTPSPERPIAQSFAASSDADKRKRGLFRR
jgi:tetratricopeptide (TPR) repeat protein